MTPTKPRPVVRVVIELYPRKPDADDMQEIGWVAKSVLPHFHMAADYRRPRVVSVRRVRARRK